MKVASSSLLISAIALAVFQLPASANVELKNSVTVNAKPDNVWKALMEYQKEEKAFHKKLVSTRDDSVSIKEEFLRVPVVGSACIDYNEVSHRSENRIDYKLTDSKVLTKFEGAWSIQPTRNNDGTILTLTTDIDSWMPIPFKNKILRNSTSKGMEKRLAFVKNYAEHLEQ